MSPGVDIKDVNFDIEPYILKNNDSMFLIYKVHKETIGQVRLITATRRTDEKFYYFFIGRVSFAEYGNGVKRPISKDVNTTKLFESGSVYWLNPDKSEQKLKIVNK